MLSSYVKGASNASLSRVVVGVVLRAPSAILMLELWVVFRLFRVDILADAYREDSLSSLEFNRYTYVCTVM